MTKKTVNIEESKNKEYNEEYSKKDDLKTTARNLNKDVDEIISSQKATSSQKANSMANATLGKKFYKKQVINVIIGGSSKAAERFGKFRDFIFNMMCFDIRECMLTSFYSCY